MEEKCEKAPNPAELAKNEDDGIRAREEALVREFMIFDNVDGIKASSADGVALENAGSERAL